MAQLTTAERRLDLIAWAAVVTFVVSRIPTLDQPLYGRHGFRETQTAYTAVWFRDHGISLLHPVLPVFGRASEVPFELPLYQAVAALLMHLGLSPTVALRSLALACFAVTAALLHVYVRLLTDRRRATVAVVVLCVSPFSLLWSRGALIEFMATAGGLAWALGFVRWPSGRTRLRLACGLAGGLVVMTVKPTTGLAYLLVAALPLLLTGIRPLWARRYELALLGVPPVLAAAAWTRWADAAKARNPLTESITSSGLTTWNFGTLAQRTTGTTWQTIAARVVPDVLGGVVGLVAVVWAIGLAKHRAEARVFLLACVATVGVFFNLYVVHDYYLAALTPLLAAVVALGLTDLAERLAEAASRSAKAATLPRWALAVVVVAWGAVATITASGYAAEASAADLAPEGMRALVAEVDRTTRPTDDVLATGIDWDPELFFHAGRRGTMLPGGRFTAGEAVLGDGAIAARTTAAVVVGDRARAAAVLQRWRWVASVGPHTLRKVDRPIATADEPWTVAASELEVPAPTLLDTADRPAALELACDGPPQAMPAGPLVLRRSGPLVAAQWLRISAAPGPVPALANVLVAASPPDATVSCTGGGILRYEVERA